MHFLWWYHFGALHLSIKTEQLKPTVMKKQFFVWFTQAGNVHSRIEFATCDMKAKEQAINHFALFGYGDEVIFGIDQF